MSIPILHVRSGFLVGGPEKLILSGITGMSGTEFSFTLASFVLPQRENHFLTYAKEHGIETVPIPVSSSFDREAITQLRALLARQRPGLVVSHDYRALALSLLAKRGTGIPVLAVAHGWTSQSLKVRLYEFVERRLLRYANAVVAVSKLKYAELEHLRIPKQKLHLIENGVAIPLIDKTTRLSDFRQSLAIGNEQIIIGSIGRLSKEKGHAHLIEAAARLCADFPQARFVLVGDGVCRDHLKRLAAERGVDMIVLFPGWRSDMETVYRGLDIVALPSLTEGLPMALLEAMSYGVPSVASAVGGCPDVIEQDLSGILCPPGDVAALEAALRRLISDSSLRRKFGEAGYARVVEKYSMKRYVEQFEQLYRQVIGSAQS